MAAFGQIWGKIGAICGQVFRIFTSGFEELVRIVSIGTVFFIPASLTDVSLGPKSVMRILLSA